MKILSLLYYSSFIVYFYYGFSVIKIYKKSNTENALPVIFFIMCMVFGLWSLNHTFLISSDTKEVCWILYKLCVPCIVLFPALILNFFIKYCIKIFKKKPVFIFYIIYIPAVIFIVKGLTGMFTVKDFIKNIYGWEFIHNTGSIWYIAYTIYYIGYITISILLTVIWFKKAKSFREKIQTKIIIITALTTFFINIVLQSILPAFKNYQVPQISMIIILIWITGIWYSIKKYKLMEISNEITGENIFSNINEIVLILNPALKIIAVNKSFYRTTGLKPKNVIKKSIFDFIICNENVIEIFNMISKLKNKEVGLRLYFKTSKEPFMTDTTLSAIKDKFSDFIGVLIISKENKGKAQLQKIYNITDREFTIIENIILGLSNREIAEKFNLSEKTVEAHLTNIYNKLSVNKKIELLNFVSNFNIKPLKN